MSTLTEPHTNGHDRDLGGVRTYRGRKLEDLIPQIRAELGPDAIILRQREGLMGGVGGFFAQKCVEVDAQAGPGRDRNQIDIYDEDEPVNGWDDFTEDDLFDATPPPVAADPSPIEFPALPAPEEPVAPPLTPAAQYAAPAPEVAIPGPEAASPALPAEAASPALPTEGAAESFVTRLEQAAAHVDIDELVKLVTTGGLPATDQVAPARRADRPPGPGPGRRAHRSGPRSPSPSLRPPRSPLSPRRSLRPPRRSSKPRLPRRQCPLRRCPPPLPRRRFRRPPTPGSPSRPETSIRTTRKPSPTSSPPRASATPGPTS